MDHQQMKDIREPQISPNAMEDDEEIEKLQSRRDRMISNFVVDCKILSSILIEAIECINIKRDRSMVLDEFENFDSLKKGPAKVYVDIEYSNKGMKLVTVLDSIMIASIDINTGNFTEYNFDPELPPILFRVNLKDILESLKIYNQSNEEFTVFLKYPGKDKSLVMYGTRSSFTTQVAIRTQDLKALPDFAYGMYKDIFECRMGGNIFYQSLQEVIWIDDILNMDIYKDMFILSAEKIGFGKTEIKHEERLRSIRDYKCKEERKETYKRYLFDQLYKSFPLRNVANLELAMNTCGMLKTRGKLEIGNNHIPVEYIIKSNESNDMDDSDSDDSDEDRLW